MAVADQELLEEFEAERPGRKLTGPPAIVLAVLGAALSLFAIYWVFQPMSAQVYRPAFLAVALLLTFLVFGRAGTRTRARSTGCSASRRSSPSAMPP